MRKTCRVSNYTNIDALYKANHRIARVSKFGVYCGHRSLCVKKKRQRLRMPLPPEATNDISNGPKSRTSEATLSRLDKPSEQHTRSAQHYRAFRVGAPVTPPTPHLWPKRRGLFHAADCKDRGTSLFLVSAYPSGNGSDQAFHTLSLAVETPAIALRVSTIHCAHSPSSS